MDNKQYRRMKMHSHTEGQIIQYITDKMSDRPKIIQMFKSCYQNTLETTIHRHEEDGTVFMLTGD
jgi:meiotically up-regulated gene 157 (Mug157) protein